MMYILTATNSREIEWHVGQHKPVLELGEGCEIYADRHEMEFMQSLFLDAKTGNNKSFVVFKDEAAITAFTDPRWT